MKVAIYTLTRDRVDYTRQCFQLLKEKAGIEYDHFIVDNGSKDGTVEWLNDNSEQFKKIIYNGENVGIGKASNQALHYIMRDNYDLVIKFDNDCEIVSDNIIGQIAEVFNGIKEFDGEYILSPKIEGLKNQPTRIGATQIAGRRVGLV